VSDLRAVDPCAPWSVHILHIEPVVDTDDSRVAPTHGRRGDHNVASRVTAKEGLFFPQGVAVFRRVAPRFAYVQRGHLLLHRPSASSIRLSGPNDPLRRGGRAPRRWTLRNRNRGRRRLVCCILLPASCREYPLLRSRGETFRSGEARPLAADWPLRVG